MLTFTRNLAASIAAIMLAGGPAPATWSICMSDTHTDEVAVGTVTCLTGFDLLAIVPVVVVGEGAAAVQAAGDFGGSRRPVIFEGLMDDVSPASILASLESFPGHEERQYGIVDTNGDAVTFTGADTFSWAGGVTGSQGTLRYAIQGNILAGPCVVPAIEAALLGAGGNMAEKLMAGMEAAAAFGGDGRCSCPAGMPESCGCPPADFVKSGHIGGMIVARFGDTDDPTCASSGCADGSYYMRLNVPFQAAGAPEPMEQLRDQFDAWRADLIGRPDGLRSTVAFAPASLVADGAGTATMTITLVDWQGDPAGGIVSMSVTHFTDSAGSTAIGPVADVGGGIFEVQLTAGTMAGLDRFKIKINDGFTPVTISPLPELLVRAPADLDADGDVDFGDLVTLLADWGICPLPPPPCAPDLDGDGIVGFSDLLTLLASWTG